jgi:hypothetical protein
MSNTPVLFTRFNRPKRHQQDLTRQTEDIFELDDKFVPVKCGETNIYAKIQEFKSDSEVYTKLERFEKGDITALGSGDSNSYADVSKSPKDLLEANEAIAAAYGNFQKLPAALRAEFGNSVSKFMAATPEQLLAAYDKISKASAQEKVEVKSDSSDKEVK